jgi:transcriptional regulator with XRE-family HTH domain
MIVSLELPYVSERGGKLSASRYPTVVTFERISEALGVDPSVFPEYRLAKARERLDERKVGYDAALGSLHDWITGEMLLAERKAREGGRNLLMLKRGGPRLAEGGNAGEAG